MSIKEMIISIAGIVDYLIVLVAAIALLVFFWGLMKFIFNAGDTTAQEQGRNTMVWGLIALFVMFSVSGLVKFFEVAFNFRAPDNIVDTPPYPPLPDEPGNPRNI